MSGPACDAGLKGVGRVAGRVRGRLRGGMRGVLLWASMPAFSAVNAVVGLLLPALLGPTQFGQYAIAVTLFQYGLILDLGLAQLLDRRLPVLMAAGAEAELRHVAGQVLWVRLVVAGVAGLGGAALMAGLEAAGRLPFPALAGTLSLVGGLGFMLALGPMSVWRATAQREAFTRWNVACAVVLAVGRPLGMVLGGLTGCFGLLAAGYAVLAARVGTRMRPRREDRPSAREALRLVGLSLPLFATSFVWAFYMTANRWVVSFAAPEVELGQFAFGANAIYLVVGTVAALAQLHYPKLVAEASRGAFRVSAKVRSDMLWLTVLCTVVSAAGILAGPRMIELLYPRFAGGEQAACALAAAVPAAILASWLMPLALSTAARPWVDGLVTYPAALAVLMAATWVGYQVGGISDAGWGLAASAVPLVAMQLTRLWATRVVRAQDGLVLLGAAVAATAGLAALAALR